MDLRTNNNFGVVKWFEKNLKRKCNNDRWTPTVEIDKVLGSVLGTAGVLLLWVLSETFIGIDDAYRKNNVRLEV